MCKEGIRMVMAYMDGVIQRVKGGGVLVSVGIIRS